MHSPLEIAKHYVDIGIHKTMLSAFKMILLGFFAGMFIAFAGIAATTASTTLGSTSTGRLIAAIVFPAGMALRVVSFLQVIILLLYLYWRKRYLYL